MKMNTTNKALSVGGTLLLLIMILQFYSNYQIESNFNEYQEKRFEYAKKDLIDSGFSETQANAVANGIKDEVITLKSAVFSSILRQTYMTAMSCLIVLIITISAINKSKKN